MRSSVSEAWSGALATRKALMAINSERGPFDLILLVGLRWIDALIFFVIPPHWAQSGSLAIRTNPNWMQAYGIHLIYSSPGRLNYWKSSNMTPKLIDLPKRYVAALRNHLSQESQASLEQAAALGREALASGLETLDVA